MKSIILLALLLIISCPYTLAHARPEVDFKQLLQAAANKNDKVAIIAAADSLGTFYEYRNVNDSAVRYFLIAAQNAQTTSAPETMLRYLYKIGYQYKALGEFYIALDYYDKAQALACDIHNAGRQAAIYRAMGEAYNELNDYTAGLAAFQKALVLQDSLHNTEEIANIYTNVAELFGRQNKFAAALENNKIADSLLRKANDAKGVAINKVNTAIVYKNMGRYNDAIALYKECIKAFEGDDYATMEVYGNMAPALAGVGRNNEADLYFRKADSINDAAIKDNWVTIENNNEWAKACLAINNADAALTHALKSKKAARDNSKLEKEQLVTIGLLAEIYSAKGELQQANKYYRQYAAEQDTLFRKQQSKKLAEAETRFNLYEKNKALDVLTLRTQRDTIIQGALLSVLLLIGLLVGIVIAAYRRTLRSNEQLAAQKLIIESQVAQLSAAGEEKTRFMQNVSHELRTPVTLLTGMLEMLKRRPEAGDEKKISIAYNNSRKLQAMVEEILDLSKLDNGEPLSDAAPLQLAPLLEQITGSFSDHAAKEQVSISFDAVEEVRGLYVTIEESKFEKIINNLLYNAIKFNRQGGWIKVTARRAGYAIVITISDSGYGISAADLSHIYERFYKGDTKNKASGTGIGLALVKEFTLQAGGSIEVESKEGTSTAFSLSFPLAEGQDADMTGTTEAAPEENWERFARQPLVLVVEDNEEMRYYIGESLGGKVAVAMAANGAEALGWLKNNRPDVIITDIMMPVMDGRALLKALKRDVEYRKLPVVVLSALKQKSEELKALQMGVDDYMVKPFNADELRIRVYNLLCNRDERSTYLAAPAENGAAIPDPETNTQFQDSIKKYVVRNMKNADIAVEDVAKALALSERQFYRLAKSTTGFTPAQLIKEIRLVAAYDLLLTGDIYKIEDLAHRVGFEHVSYFSKLFLARFGKRPSEFLS